MKEINMKRTVIYIALSSLLLSCQGAYANSGETSLTPQADSQFQLQGQQQEITNNLNSYNKASASATSGSVNNTETQGNTRVYVAPAPVQGVTPVASDCSHEVVGVQSVGLFFNAISHSMPRVAEKSTWCKILNKYNFAVSVGNTEKAKELEQQLKNISE